MSHEEAKSELVSQAGDAEAAEPADAVEPALDATADPAGAMQEENAALRDRYLRLAAEFDNFRKRQAREWHEQKQRAAAEVLREMLELADNLERALQTKDDSAAGLRKGVELILQQLQVKLKAFGVEAIDTDGQPFDPMQHEAILVVDTEDVESSRIVDVVQRGYTLHGEVLRPARVTVSR